MSDFSTEVMVPLSIISFLVVTTNIAVCLLVFKIKNMRTYTNGFVVSLALSDILTGVTLIIQYTIELHYQSRIAINILYALVLFCGVWNICAVTYDRYLAVVRPFSYRTVIPKFFKISLPLIWTLSLTIASLPAFAWKGNINLLINKVYIFFTFFFCAVLPFTIIIYANLRIFMTVRKCVKKERELSISTEAPRQDVKDSKHRAKKISTEAKVAKVFAIAASMLILSWFPVFIHSGAFVFNNPGIVPKEILNISPFTIALGSLVNPILYSFMKPDFRHAIEKILRRRGGNDIRFHRSSFLPSFVGSESNAFFSEKNNNKNKNNSIPRRSWASICNNDTTCRLESQSKNLLSVESAI
ncbi:probable G-protein coupled receptor No9 [Actinia tenebrosa]|uniref:Probable G-protein coupled receptor No9 n=1 Tax=Actinia tenebrosa TaxID=6105 RepID=A0A6P8HMR2_ACTTE|nr:probable G-protein coupled receptor No9 [Actinia tenebrosa]XP_031556986.1 probable G-protein coupled receptor No9 [Actinia tenebrosa]XP_031556987.1 probable G-protein coupled receptor No9 [Actinia tenebrosa]XP_031556988.1 probable G-protein coupled receptor No9 [Actinia tenebrosa]